MVGLLIFDTADFENRHDGSQGRAAAIVFNVCRVPRQPTRSPQERGSQSHKDVLSVVRFLRLGSAYRVVLKPLNQVCRPAKGL